MLTKNVPHTQHCLWRSSNVSILYKTTARSIGKNGHKSTAPYHFVEPHFNFQQNSYFQHSIMNNPLSKLKAKSTGKQCVQSNSLLPGGHAHMASDADHEPEPRAFAEGGATLERPAAVDNCIHWPELSKFLTVSDVTMSAQQSGWGLSANGKVPRVARALIASSRFMKHARVWPADLLKKKVCSRPCCKHSDWMLGPSNCNNNKSSTSISISSMSTANITQMF